VLNLVVKRSRKKLQRIEEKLGLRITVRPMV